MIEPFAREQKNGQTTSRKTAWVYDPFYYSRIVPITVRATGGGSTTSGNYFTSGEVFIPSMPSFEPEELRCEYCGRKHGRGQEECKGCGAPL